MLRLALAFGLVASGAALATVNAPAAQAAEGTATEVTSWEFQNSGTLTNGRTYWLDMEWQAVDQTSAVPTITMDFALPAEIEGAPTTFNIFDSSSVQSGSCTVTKTAVSCTLLDDYVTNNPNNIKGKFSIQGKLNFENLTEETTKTLLIDQVEHTFTVKPPTQAGACEGDACNWKPRTDHGSKSLTYKEDGTAEWDVYVPSVSSEGLWESYEDGSMTPGLEITVTDDLQAGQTYKSGPQIWELSCIRHGSTGAASVTGWRDVTDSITKTVSSDNLSVTFTTQAPPAGACDGVTNSSSAPEGTPDPYALNGNTYVVSWDFTNDNHDLGGKQTLTNKADITIADVELTQVNKSQEVQIAGGSAGGDASNAIPGTPTVNPAECGVNDTGTVWETVTLPTGGFFTYTQDTDADHKVTVTATVKPGAVLTDDLPDGWTANADRSAATWTYQLKSEECSTPEVSVVPVAPVVNPAECTVDTQGTTVWETVTQPANTDGITYSDVVVSDDHVATITATAAEGFVLDAEALGDGWVMNEDGTATWTYQLKSKTCAAAPIVKPTTPGLATTGGTLPLGLAGGAVVLLLAGLVTVAAAKRQRANQQ